MSQKTITRADLSEAVRKELGLAKREAENLVDDVFDQILDALAKRETVKLSSFGVFSILHKNPRMGRNPKTGEEAPITARDVVTFRASQVLKSKTNGR